MTRRSYAVEIQDYSGEDVTFTYLVGEPHAGHVGFSRKYRDASGFEYQVAQECAAYMRELYAGQKGIYIVVVEAGEAAMQEAAS